MNQHTGKVRSPLTNTENTEFLWKIESEELIRQYEELFELDVSAIFSDVEFVSLYRCKDSGYEFFYPLSTAGDDDFYSYFGSFPWYYIPWKWEHEICADLVKEDDKVLEVGSGEGGFLEELAGRVQITGTGLELNSLVVEKHQSRRNIKLINQSIQEHTMSNSSKYNMVCSFQVLEHISNVYEVVKDMIECICPGGTLVISVPNNDGFIGTNVMPSRILNMPPHHMGRWNRQSLENLCNYFPITLKEIVVEPLQEIHSDTYQYNAVKKILFNSQFLIRVYWKLRLHMLVRPLLKLFSTWIVGHSIIAVYQKDIN